MASGFAVAVAQGVLGKLGEIAAQQVLNEASLLLNFKEDLKSLQKKFSRLCGYLQDADNQSAHNAPLKEWLADVRDVALDAQDIIDECAVEHLYRNSSQTCVGSYQPSTSGTSDPRGAQFRRGRVILEEDPRAVGVDEKAEEIERLLEQPEVRVVAVVGMGGLGKTFLMQHVYKRSKQRYELSAWVSVSQNCSLRTLQSDVAKQINLQVESSISDVLVADSIHGHLEGKSCLIVLDDVWDASVEGNIIQRLGFSSDRNNQCRIVVITRNREIAANIRAHIYEMQQLSKEDSWTLFCLFAFPHTVQNRAPEDLESLARQIVEKCGGMPLAVKTVASSMSASVGSGEWEFKLRQLKNVDLGAENHTMEILKLSCNSLPSHLKCCFAYFSFFPEDTEIHFIRQMDPKYIQQDYLIYLWIAEGFVPQENEKDQCDIGLNYLHQLVNLCLVEVNQVEACYTVHDLLHDLAINVSKEQKCEFHLPLQDSSCGRLILGKKGITDDALLERALHRHQFLRTVSLFENLDITCIPQHLFHRLRLLRVLDFSRTAISALSNSVGKLKLLKVLNLSQTKITQVPDCVRRLKSLLFLDVSGCIALKRLPLWMGELLSLSHLDTRKCSDELKRHMPKGISDLVSLRTLRFNCIPLYTEENELLNVKDVGNLINLQEIAFSVEDVGGLRIIEDGVLEPLVKMRILQVRNNIPSSEGDILPSFPQKLNVMKDLQHLILERFSVPSWICGMVSLTVLILPKCSDYRSLQNMPDLHTLGLRSDRRCRELPKKFGERGGFPKLLRLGIIDLPLLEELPALDEGAMQSLEVLLIENCPRVKKVAEGLEPLKRLKRIQVRQASGELEERLKECGEDFSKIKAHNPHIQIIIS